MKNKIQFFYKSESLLIHEEVLKGLVSKTALELTVFTSERERRYHNNQEVCDVYITPTVFEIEGLDHFLNELEKIKPQLDQISIKTSVIWIKLIGNGSELKLSNDALKKLVHLNVDLKIDPVCI